MTLSLDSSVKRSSMNSSVCLFPEGFTVRQASTADLDTLVLHRRAMFYDMGYTDAAALDSMAAKFRPWLLARMDSGDYLTWLVSAPDGSVAAGARALVNGLASAHDWHRNAARQHPQRLYRRTVSPSWPRT